MKRMEKLLLAKMFGTDQESIPYRPRIASVVKSITATILFQQMVYWWVKQDEQAFYKFKEPCKHKLYKAGDSWCEELGFSRAEFDTAISKIAVKKTKNISIEQARQTANKERKPVVYWITPGRVTYYTVVLDVVISILAEAYKNPLKRESSDRKSENPAIDLKQESSDTISETTTETNTDTLAPRGKRDSEKRPEMIEYQLEPDDVQFRCTNPYCDEVIKVDDLPSVGASCPFCEIPLRLRNSKGTVIKKPSQKARRQESFDGNLERFDDKPLRAFCALYGVPYEGLTPKKKKTWAHQIQKVADENGASANLTYQAIRAIKGSEYAWKSFSTPYSTGFQDILAVMIMRQGKEPEPKKQQQMPTRIKDPFTGEWRNV